MKATRGYYSVIQYCPDASRLEAANIGVLLFCPDIRFVRARTAAGNDRIRRFFRGQAIDLYRVNAAKRAIERRLETDRDRFRTPGDLIRFAETRGNYIILTTPRSMKVLDAERELEQLFDELVGGRARRTARKVDFPEVDAIFRRPTLQDRVLFDRRLSVPVLERQLRVPYAYCNGAMNLVKPQRFGVEESQAMPAAARLAIEGDLLARHPIGDQAHKLIVVPTYEAKDPALAVCRRVDDLLGEYKVRVVHRNELSRFAAEIEREARAVSG
jgi:hypothetical protein